MPAGCPSDKRRADSMSEPHTVQPDTRQDARSARAARLDAARRELAEASGRGEGGRHALRQYLASHGRAHPAAVRGRSRGVAAGRHLCARRLRPPPAVPALRHRSAGPVRRRDRRRGRAVPARVPQSAVGSRSDGRPPGPRGAAKLPPLEADNPEFLLALLDARPVAGDAALFDRFVARVPHAARRTPASLDGAAAADRRAPRAVQRHALPARARREGSARRRCAICRRRGRSRR